MTGQGTGGGGALALLLVLWLVAIAFIVGDWWQTEEPVVADPPPVASPAATPTPEPEPVPTPTPRPQLPECEGDACAEPVTRAEMAQAFSRAFRLPPTTVDYFTDDDGLPQEPSINRVAAAGITSGCAEDRFCPDREITRAQMASFLDRALDLPGTDEQPFTDIEGLVHEGAINRVAAAGLTSGCDEERYCPESTVTWRQLIIFLDRAVTVGTE